MVKIDSKKIQEAITNISNRIEVRFPDSSLYLLSKELLITLSSINETVIYISKPKKWIRILFISIALIFAFLFGSGIKVLLNTTATKEINGYIQSTEAALNAFALIGAAFFFMFKLEERLKENIILKNINELRMFIHLIDMYQLGKDPLSIKPLSTIQSNQNIMDDFEMGRYFNYCCELLSLSSKMAVLFINENTTERVSEAINEIELLSAALNRKIWQKIALLDKPISN